MAARFLLAHRGASGKSNALMIVARQLARRGHIVCFLANTEARTEIEAAGFRARVWTGTIADTPLSPPDSRVHPLAMADISDHVAMGAAGSHAADTLEAFEQERTDALLADALLFGAALAAEVASIPCALLPPDACIGSLSEVPVSTGGFAPLTTQGERRRAFVAARMAAERMNSQLSAFNDLRAILGLAPLGHVVEQYDRADQLIGQDPAVGTLDDDLVGALEALAVKPRRIAA